MHRKPLEIFNKPYFISEMNYQVQISPLIIPNGPEFTGAHFQYFMGLNICFLS